MRSVLICTGFFCIAAPFVSSCASPGSVPPSPTPIPTPPSAAPGYPAASIVDTPLVEEMPGIWDGPPCREVEEVRAAVMIMGFADGVGAEFIVNLVNDTVTKDVQSVRDEPEARRMAAQDPEFWTRLHWNLRRRAYMCLLVAAGVDCAQGKAPGCAMKHAILTRGIAVKRDPLAALQVIEKVCERPSPATCMELARIWLDWPSSGDAYARDARNRAIEIYQRACGKKRPFACHRLAALYEQGNGVEKSTARAGELEKQADTLIAEICSNPGEELGISVDMDGCFSSAVEFAGESRSVHSLQRAIPMLEKACAQKHGEACHLLGRAYELGEGVTTSAQKACALYRKACEGLSNATSCASLCRCHRNGSGAAKDPHKAVAACAAACDGNDASGCMMLGFMRHVGVAQSADDGQALALYKKACNLNSQPACSNLAELLTGAGNGVDIDEARARTLFGKACEWNVRAACANLAYMNEHGLGGPADPVKAKDLYERSMLANARGKYRLTDDFRESCEEGDSRSCTLLGVLQAKGLGVPPDAAHAAALWTKACAAGDPWACDSGRQP